LAENEGEESGSTEGPAAHADPECVSLVEAEVADDAYARGVAKLEEARDGEHYLAEPFDEAMGALESAAKQGHRGAQSLFGRRMFETMFMSQAPQPEERQSYISALAFLRIAGVRGDEEAAGYLPGFTDEPDLSEPPLDSIPSEWVMEAMAEADAWLACHGEAVGERGAR